ncbi:MAG: exbB2, partial [Verrucomicrobiaceae bacterium]|nr:exbB2 [Verrucomicrobiaceae bacterium]
MLTFSSLLTRRLMLALLMLTGMQGALHAAEEKEAHKWWDAKWPARKKITIDTSDKGSVITDPIGTTPVLVRLHDGDFNFMAAKEDGSDLRFVSEDGKTVLKHHIEKWDGILNEAYVWVSVPEVKPSAETHLWLYYGNLMDAVKAEDAKGTYDASTILVYHFADTATVGADSSASAIAAQGALPPVTSSQVAGGERLMGQMAVTIPDAPAMEWAAGSALTWSAWVKPTALQPNAVVFSRHDGANSFVIGMDNGAPYVEINKQRSAGSIAGAPAVWQHLAVVVKDATTTVYTNGAPNGTLAVGLPALKGSALIGKDITGTGFVGELDELQIAKVARDAGYLKLAAIGQGNSPEFGKLFKLGADEASDAAEEGELQKQMTLIKDISKSLTLDGWVVIVLCILLAVIGWGVAIAKVLYLNKIGKASKAFLQRWEKLSNDLTAIDHGDADSVKTMGGAAGGKAQKLMRKSPLYYIYHIGSEEISNRVSAKGGFNGLSGRSIQAIKASLHGALMREVGKLNSQIVFLTIGIAGGPYLGLLG